MAEGGTLMEMKTAGYVAQADAAKDDPLFLFGEWMALASSSEVNDPNAMTIATVDEDGMPDSRMVLLKGVEKSGFVFYTNLESAKGRQLLASQKAALCFHWKSIRRQIRIRGLVEVVSDDEADIYYASRERGSRIGAWVSQQSRPLESRHALEEGVAEMTLRYAVGNIPRPAYWSGFRISPLRIEFWEDRPFRLHDRLVYSRADLQTRWQTERLYP